MVGLYLSLFKAREARRVCGRKKGMEMKGDFLLLPLCYASLRDVGCKTVSSVLSYLFERRTRDERRASRDNESRSSYSRSEGEAFKVV